MQPNRALLSLLFFLVPFQSLAQEASPLPKGLKGYWSVSHLNIRQVFELTAIEPTSKEAATGRLTWWTVNTRCAIKEQPVQIKVTAEAITFDASNVSGVCDISFAVELSKSGAGWKGKAEAKQGVIAAMEASEL